jgi:hypothetical protein
MFNKNLILKAFGFYCLSSKKMIKEKSLIFFEKTSKKTNGLYSKINRLRLTSIRCI